MSNPAVVPFSDLELPRAAVLRILKKANDGKLMVQKDAKLALTKSATLFISYLTAAAQQNASKMGQKTISANHTFAALEVIGFAEFVEPLKSRLEQYMAAKEKKKTGSNDEIGGDQSAMDLDTKADDDEDLEEGPDPLEAEEEDLEEQIDQLDIETESNESGMKRARLDEMLAISNSLNDDEDEEDDDDDGNE